jgi:hypothetical protein
LISVDLGSSFVAGVLLSAVILSHPDVLVMQAA